MAKPLLAAGFTKTQHDILEKPAHFGGFFYALARHDRGGVHQPSSRHNHPDRHGYERLGWGAGKKGLEVLRKNASALRANAKRVARAGIVRSKAKISDLNPFGKVKKVGSQRPRNHAYAGDVYPASAYVNDPLGQVAKMFPDGVKFSKSGFPIFSKHVKDSVVIKLGATSKGDISAANLAAGYAKTPRGFTWHHHQTEGLMQLILTKLHDAVQHTGGRAFYNARH